MKNYNKLSTTKLVARFDNDLKNILMEDLKAFKAKGEFLKSNNQVAAQQLSAA